MNIIEEACRQWECSRAELTLADLRKIKDEAEHRLRNLLYRQGEQYLFRGTPMPVISERIAQRQKEIQEIDLLIKETK